MSKYSSLNDSISDTHILVLLQSSIALAMTDLSIHGYVWRMLNVHDQQSELSRSQLDLG